MPNEMKDIRKNFVFDKSTQKKLDEIKRAREEECGESLSEGHIVRLALTIAHKEIVLRWERVGVPTLFLLHNYYIKYV